MDGERLRSALAGADLRVLLMVVFHLSGDRRWLEAPFQPRRDVNLIAAEDAGLAREEQDEIRAAAHALRSDAASTAAIGDPGDALMVEMMSVCLGERVPEEYAPMMREELGFTSRDVEWPSRRQPAAASQRRVLIVGAGASGIAMGARLGRLGIPYVIVERNSEVGGTWFENRYPGCGVDTPNHAYSFSFGSRYPWSRYFSPRGEIQDYLVRCADEFGVRPNIRFATAVTSATWDESTSRWNVGLATPEGDDTLTGDFLVTAIGQFGLPSIPELDGIDRFRGASFHSAAWPDALDVTGRRVAILGTGASAMQIAPTIADRAASLTLYQRSAQWARPIPRYRDSMGADAQWLLASVPFYAEWFRFTMLWRYGDGLLRFLRKDPDWPHPDRSLNRINDRHRQEMTDHIASELAERSDLIPACVPTYPPYGKRILLDNGWYTTLTKLNVELVTDAIDHVDELGIATRDGSHRAADIIVYATGFQMTQMASRLNICGREGLRLDDAWADENPTAYLGISVPGMPNLFLMQGPNSGLGHGGSAIFLSECQARYITGLLLGMIDAEVSAIDVRREVHDDYVQRVDAEHEQLIWTHPGMSTYYRNRH